MVTASMGGRIINIASIDALHPTGALTHYDTSKGGLVMMTKSLAKEFGPYGITVNAIAPGSIATPGRSGDCRPKRRNSGDEWRRGGSDGGLPGAHSIGACRPAGRHRYSCALPGERRRLLRDGELARGGWWLSAQLARSPLFVSAVTPSVRALRHGRCAIGHCDMVANCAR